MNDYKMLYVIGRGGFGKVIINHLIEVYKIQCNKTK